MLNLEKILNGRITIVDKNDYLKKYSLNIYKGNVNIRHNKKNYIQLFVLSVWISVLLLLYTKNGNKVGLYFFCIMILTFPLYFIFSKRTVLSISDKGILIREKRLLKWNEIEDVYIERIDEQPGETYKLRVRQNIGKIKSVSLNDLTHEWEEIGYIIEFFRNKAQKEME